MKEVLKKIILSNQLFIKEKQLVRRDFEISNNFNYVLTGPRRSGKTYLLYQIAKTFYSRKMERVLYINFEDERLIGFMAKDFDILLEAFSELYEHKPVLFLDEVQVVDGWEKFVRRLADTDYRIYLTGSNSQMLAGEVSSVLGGRFVIRNVMPLSFREFLQFKNFELKKNYRFSPQLPKLKRLTEEYFYYGAFPEAVKLPEEDKKEYLSNLFMKVFYGDILARYKVKNEFALKFLIKKLAENLHDEVSFNRIKNLLTSSGVKVGTNTIIEYLEYLRSAYLIYPVENYVYKLSDRQSKRKYYFVDNGLLSLFIFSPETKLLENLVFLTLKRRYGDVFYLRSKGEVDFFVPSKLMVQVAYSLTFQNVKRELKAFEEFENLCPECDKILVCYEKPREKLDIPNDVQVLDVVELVGE